MRTRHGGGRRRAHVGLVLAALVAMPAGAWAQSITETLATAYQTNPELAADIAELRATNEQIAQALSGYRPTIVGQASVGAEWTQVDPVTLGIDDPFTEDNEFTEGSSGWEQLNPATLGITVTQPIYSGGRTEAGVRQADNVIMATRAVVLTTEQTVLLAAATAYADVVQNQALVAVAENNEAVLARQLQAVRDRFNVGEVTRTDVSQAEAALAGATADRITAEGLLQQSRAAYERVVGMMPGTLVPSPVPAPLPSSLQDAIQQAQTNNPQMVAAVFSERAAADGIDLAFGALLPELTLQGQLQTTYNQQREDQRIDSAAIVAQLTVPLYQAGAAESQVREARYTAGQRRIEIESTRRTVIEAAIQAWEALITSRASIVSFRAQVAANQLALEGVEQEALVGSRTVLDVLETQQDLLDSQVNLVRAQRDEVVAAYRLLSAAGRMTAAALGLPVQIYNPEPDYQATRGRWWGTSID